MSNVEDRLHPEHLADLRKSGLSDETIEQARLATVRPNDIRKITSDERVTSLLEIPYDAEFSRYKVFPTNLKAKTKSGHFRYLQPAKTSVHLYIPPGAEVALKDLAISFGLVEGEKKALKAMQEGLLCCGLGGLYNWLEDGRLIPALKEIPLKGRAVVLYPDSDVWRRADLLEPVYRLGCALEAKGAAVTVCALPHGAGETKQGLDDYLVAESTEALHARPHVPLTHKRFDRARKKAKARDNFGKPAARPEVVTMSDVQAEPVNWLFWPYISIGKLCMLDGDPGIGKSLLMTQLAASLSRGWPLPDQQGTVTLNSGGPHTTLLLSSEDGLADTIKPRLEAAGADCTKIHVLTGWLGPEDEHHAFTLQHSEVLEAAIQKYHPRLIVIDPIQSYLGPIDMHRSNETRPLLDALKRLAEQYQCAIVLIRHPGKGQTGGKALYRGLGSMDIIGAARTGLFAEQHPTDPNRALLAHHKSNVGPLGRTLLFSKAEGRFAWAGVSRMTAEMLAGSGRGPDRHAFLSVVCTLEDRMKPGIPYKSKEMEDELKEAGYGHEVIKRAKKALGVQSIQTPQGWIWTLPVLPFHLPPSLPSTDSTHSTDTTAATATPDLKTSTYDPVVGNGAVGGVGAEVAVAGIVPGDHDFNVTHEQDSEIASFRENVCQLHGETGLLSEGGIPVCGLCLGMPKRVRHMGIDEVVIAPHAPWQNPYVERLIGSIRRECLDHVIVRNEPHLRRLLTSYFAYYHRFRTHLSLAMDCPVARPVEPPEAGEIRAIPEVGGLHHHYARQVA